MFLDPDVTRYVHLKAMSGDHHTVRKVLLNDPSQVHSTNGRLTVPPIFYACRYGHLKVCEVLLNFGANLHEQVQGWTPFFEACSGNHIHVVKWLLLRGVDPSACLKFSRMTPLMHSARRGFLTMCKVLVDHGADVWAKSVDGRMAIDFCRESSPACLDFLEREMRRHTMWKAWACGEADVHRGVSVHDDVPNHVFSRFPEDLFAELVSYI